MIVVEGHALPDTKTYYEMLLRHEGISAGTDQQKNGTNVHPRKGLTHKDCCYTTELSLKSNGGKELFPRNGAKTISVWKK